MPIKAPLRKHGLQSISDLNHFFFDRLWIKLIWNRNILFQFWIDCKWLNLSQFIVITYNRFIFPQLREKNNLKAWIKIAAQKFCKHDGFDWISHWKLFNVLSRNISRLHLNNNNNKNCTDTYRLNLCVWIEMRRLFRALYRFHIHFCFFMKDHRNNVKKRINFKAGMALASSLILSGQVIILFFVSYKYRQY